MVTLGLLRWSSCGGRTEVADGAPAPAAALPRDGVHGVGAGALVRPEAAGAEDGAGALAQTGDGGPPARSGRVGPREDERVEEEAEVVAQAEQLGRPRLTGWDRRQAGVDGDLGALLPPVIGRLA